MPELPEVQTVVDTLRPRLLGCVLFDVRLNRCDIVRPVGFDLTGAIEGRTVKSIERRAKRIVLTLDGGNVFYIHLGMTGRLTIEPNDSPIVKHTHFIARVPPSPCTQGEGWGEGTLRFCDPRRFGRIIWLGRNPEASQASPLGPEPLTLHPTELFRRLNKTSRAIKCALLDQTLIAGLGNIYVDESLFIAGIHPRTRADRLTRAQVGRLNRAIKLTLRRAIRHRGSTVHNFVDANGNSGRFQDLHNVYGRTGEPCRTCKSPIDRIVLGGRSTHFCKRCQKPAK